MSAEVHNLFESASNGWANRETYAAYVQLTADAGLMATAYAALETAELAHGAVTPKDAGEALAGLLNRFLDELLDAGLEDEYRTLRDDLGSMWRVDWAAIGEAFLNWEEAA